MITKQCNRTIRSGCAARDRDHAATRRSPALLVVAASAATWDGNRTLQVRQEHPFALAVNVAVDRVTGITRALESCHLRVSLAEQAGVPHPSVYRWIQRAEQAGLVISQKIGNARLVREGTTSPYYSGLAEVLTKEGYSRGLAHLDLLVIYGAPR